MENLVIYGGSFDPIHNGHLRTARSASMRLNADVVFVPAKKPRWKEVTASDEDRLAMLKLGIISEGSSSFSISNCELVRAGDATYSIDTVNEFAKKYPSRHLILLIGADQVNLFHKWKDPDEIASKAEIVYVDRPDIKVNEANVKRFKMKCLGFEESGSVSSHAIRSLQSVDLPAKVITYIEEHNLYYMSKISSFLKPTRLAHSLSVAHLAMAIATSNHLSDPGKAYIAGILHDIGKYLDETKAREMVATSFPIYKDYPSWCLHQFTGAILSQKEFGITDGDVLDAITYHCSGKAHMPPLSKIVYSADKIEPTRGWNSKRYIRGCLQDYYLGFLDVLRANKKFLFEKGSLEAEVPLSQECFDYYLNKKEK
jgi:nicotinate-nucleotide adenylyltransferase